MVDKTLSRRKSLKRFITQGAFSEISNNLSTSFITRFALDIGAKAGHIGLLSGLGELISPIGQLIGSRKMESQSRKRILLKFTFWQAFLWIPVLSLAFFFWKDIGRPYLPYALILFYALWALVVGVQQPPFFSWIGDLAPYKSRGKYLSKRNRITGSAGIITFVLAAFILDYTKSLGFVFTGFTIIFSLAIAVRFYNIYLTKSIYQPELKLKKDYYFSLKSFLKRYDNFGKFAVYQAFFYFGLTLASPFFAVYMLKDLGFNNITFALISLSTTFFYLLFTPLAGKFSDRYGNMRLLYVAAVMFPITPLLWIFLKNPVALFLIPGVVSGIANAALTSGVTNFTYDAVKPEKRGLCIAYVAILNGIGILIGSITGGFLIQYLPITFMKPVFFVFLLSAAVRMIAPMIFLPFIKEEKNVVKLQGFSVNFHHPFRLVRSDIVWFGHFVRSKR